MGITGLSNIRMAATPPGGGRPRSPPSRLIVAIRAVARRSQ